MYVVNIRDILKATESELIDLSTVVPEAGVKSSKDHSPISPQPKLNTECMHLRPNL